MHSWFQRLGNGLLDLLFPPLCVVCRAPSPRHLCNSCLTTISRIEPPRCHRCGQGLDLLDVPPGLMPTSRLLCRYCREGPATFTACRAYGQYTGPLRAAIQAVKYRGKTAVVPALADLLVQVWDAEPVLHPARLIVPVPLHPGRLRQRGFNQSELLARALAERTGLSVRWDLLAKCRHTHPQVGLNASQRRENLRDAFRVCVPELPREPLLLVDDVVTTGSTFHECARVLRDGGAGAVYALALAHD